MVRRGGGGGDEDRSKVLVLTLLPFRHSSDQNQVLCRVLKHTTHSAVCTYVNTRNISSHIRIYIYMLRDTSLQSAPQHTPLTGLLSLRAAGKTQRREVCNWCDKAGNILLFKCQHNKLEAQLRGEKIPKPKEQVLSAAAAFIASVQL